MQQFVRTVNTVDAFRLKIDHLHKQVEKKEAEIAELRNEGSPAGGGLLKFIGGIFVVVGLGLAIIVFYVMTVSSGVDDFIESGGLAISLFSALALVPGFRMRASGNKILNEAREKQRIAKERIPQLEAELKELKDEIKKQTSILEEHMLNQSELITQEIETIQQVASSTDDSKECPQCAETIKAKAKICRFCNYKFNDV